MCGRFLLFTCDEYEELLSIIRDVEINNPVPNIDRYPKADIFPGDLVPVITTASDHNKTVILSKWGFPNFKERNRLLINARSETVEEKPTFKKLILTKRCLIPAIGFYEWKTHDNKKEKYLIQLKPTQKDFALFYMAGLYNEFIDPSGTNYTGFVILTTAANKEMQQIHDRMPVIIPSKAAADKWIGSSSSQIASIKAMMTPYENELYIENQTSSSQLQLELQLQFKM
jgi:putative SOS response-associated peptidase YedK